MPKFKYFNRNELIFKYKLIKNEFYFLNIKIRVNLFLL